MENKEKNRKIIRNSFFISIIVCFGKVLGFLKQAVIAWTFGANAGTDIYFAADSYIAIFGQIQTASISPSILTEHIYLSENYKRQELEGLLRKCFVVFPFIALLLILLNILLSEQTSTMLGISYSFEQRRELQKFIIYLCPVIFFASLSGVSQGILDANERFVPSKLLSLFFSIAIIVFVFLFHNELGVKSMLLGFLVGYGAHTLYIYLLAKKYFTFGKINRKDESFKKVMQNVFPLVIGNSVVDIGHLVDKIIASSLVTGSVSYLYYGQVISNDLVNAVIITTIGTVLFPPLTRMVVNKCEGSIIANRISEILSIIVAVLLAITGLYIVVGSDLIRIFFERGNFSSIATLHVTKITVFYAIGFAFMATREILVKTHYAYQDTTTPMKNGIVGVVINTVLSFMLSRIMGISGVALATSISMAVVASMMCYSIKKHIGVFPLNKKFWISLTKDFFCILVMIFIGELLRSVLVYINYTVRMIIIAFAMLLIYVVGFLILKHDIIDQVKELIIRE